MVISNFVFTRQTGSLLVGDRIDFAEVDVTTGVWRWKKTRRVVIFRNGAGFWKFMDTGEFTPGFQVETLQEMTKAQAAFGERNA
jgi:hypothetical protein